jgi:hypothetical protein
MGVKRARLYLSVSTSYVETAHKVYKLPPMSASAASKYLEAKLAGDFSALPNDVIWDRPLIRNGKSAGVKSILTLAARRSDMAPLLDLEDKGFTVELLTSPEMAVWALARRAGLLNHKDALLVYPTTEKVHMVAAGPTGPFFARSVDVGAGLEGFVLMRTVLPAEVRHALISLQQHQQRTISRLIIVGSATPEDAAQDLGRAVGIEVSCFGAEDLIVPPKASDNAPIAEWSLLAASLPLVGASPPAVNLARTHVASRQSAKTLGAVGWIAAVAALAAMFTWGLDLDIAEQRARVRVAELEQSVAELKTLPPPVVDWRVTEVNAVKKLAEHSDLQAPPLAQVLHELGHMTPKPVRFESLAISKGGVMAQTMKPGPGRKKMRTGTAPARTRGKAQTETTADASSKPWMLEISGTVSDRGFASLQSSFRAWYEDAAVSPYLARLDIGSAEIEKRDATAGTPGSRRARTSAPAGESSEASDSVLRFNVSAELPNTDAVRKVLAALDQNPRDEL